MDSPAYGGADNAGDTLRILIIRLSDGMLMGSVKTEVFFDTHTKAYSLENLTNSDVAFTEELNAAQREMLIAEAVQYLTNGNDQMTLGVTKEELESQNLSTIVENSQRVYYNRLFDADGNAAAPRKRNGHNLSQPNQESRRGMPPR